MEKSILKRKGLSRINKNCKFVGFNAPTNLFDYIELFGNCTNQSRTTIINEIIKEWIEKKEASSENIVILIAEKAFSSWNEYKPLHDFDDFCAALEKEILPKIGKERTKRVLSILTKKWLKEKQND